MAGARPPQVSRAIDALTIDVKLAVRIDIEDIGQVMVPGPLFVRRISHMHHKGMAALSHSLREEGDIAGSGRGVDHRRDISQPHLENIRHRSAP
jgi:hypothetical protein